MKWLINFTILAVTIVCMVLIGEMVLRLKFKAWPFEENATLEFMTPKDSVLLFRMPPGEGKNSLGLRNINW